MGQASDAINEIKIALNLNPGAAKYYAQMACAWLVSVCFVKFPKKTFGYLKKRTLQKEIHQKIIRKIVESIAISPDWKIKVKECCS